MKLRLQENPQEWRKNALLTAGGVAMLSSLLRWRGKLHNPAWFAVLGAMAVLALAATLAPRWFRGYYRFSHRLGFHFARIAGNVVLFFFFTCIITPMGIILRAFGQDALRLKRPPPQESYWSAARENGPLDRMF